MVDYISMRTDNIFGYPLPDNEGKMPDIYEVGQLEMYIQRHKKGGHIKHYCCESNSLMFILTERVLIVSNSLHKFLKNENHSDFTNLQLLKSIRLIECLTGISAENFHITKFELAINIETNQHPYKYLESFGNYKNREPDKMKIKGFRYGIKYIFSEYHVKIYDKTEEIKRREREKLSKNTLRFEIQYEKLRKTSIIKTLNDFRDKENLIMLFDDFLETFAKIDYIGNEDFSTIGQKERELYFAGQIQRYWMVEKIINRNTAKSKMARYSRIKAHVYAKTFSDIFLPPLQEKIKELLHNLNSG